MTGCAVPEYVSSPVCLLPIPTADRAELEEIKPLQVNESLRILTI